jgi:threonine dehydrogenase-like Zn-dependent dehydrogenase
VSIASHCGCRPRKPWALGAIHAADGGDVAAQVRELTGPAGADAAIEASGSYLGLHEAICCLRVGGRVATVASYHGDQPGLRLGEEYHRNRITLISSMTVNGCAQRQHPLWTFDRLKRDRPVSSWMRPDCHSMPFVASR